MPRALGCREMAESSPQGAPLDSLSLSMSLFPGGDVQALRCLSCLPGPVLLQILE